MTTVQRLAAGVPGSSQCVVDRGGDQDDVDHRPGRSPSQCDRLAVQVPAGQQVQRSERDPRAVAIGREADLHVAVDRVDEAGQMEGRRQRARGFFPHVLQQADRFARSATTRSRTAPAGRWSPGGPATNKLSSRRRMRRRESIRLP